MLHIAHKNGNLRTPPPATSRQIIDGPAQHDPLVCGINDKSDCQACRLAREREWFRRYPALAQPAPGPHNQIAGNFEEQLARVFKPRPTRPLTDRAVKRLIAAIRAHRQELRPVVLDILAEDIGVIVTRVLNQKGGRHG